MHLVITGGSGFLGRRVAAAALASGDRVTVLSRDVAAAERALGSRGPALRCRLGSPSDAASLSRALAEDPPDALVHAAAIITGSPADLHAVNVGGTATVLAACRALPRAPRLLYVSSFAVQDTPPTPYSDSKLAAEALVRASPLPWVVLRPTLIYGPGDAQNTAALVAKLRAGTMWLPGGGRTRIQPVFVDDVAAACLEAARRSSAVGSTYALGGPAPLSVRSWREAVREASGGRARILPLPLALLAPLAGLAARLGRRGALDVLAFHRADHAVDIRDAQRDLGFSPRPLREGLAATFPPG